MGMNRRRFLKWVERKMLEAGQLPKSFTLSHVGRQGSGSTLGSFAPLSDACADEIATSLADEIEGESGDHAEGCQGRQQYVVTAIAAGGAQVGEFQFWDTSGAVHHADATTALIEMTPEQAALSTGNIPEQLGHPTAMVAGQLMRHTEGLVRNLVEMSSVNRERDAQIIRQQQATIDKQTTQELKMFELMEAMQSQQQMRALAAKKYEDDERRKEALFDKLDTHVLPAVAARLGMGVGGKGKDDGQLSDVQRIFMALPREVQSAMFASLSDEDKATMMGIFKAGGAAAKAAAAAAGEVKH